MSGGRSRLHLLDLGSCDVKVLGGGGGGGGGGKSKENSSPSSAPLCLSLSALGNVILALVNGSKHIPYKYVRVGVCVCVYGWVWVSGSMTN